MLGNYILALCDKSYIVQIMLIVKTFFKIACYLAPVLIIIVSMIHIFKTVVSGKDEDFKDSLKVTVKRIIAGLLIAFLPALTNYVFDLVNASDVNFIACFESASKEKVAALKEKEEKEEEAKKKKQEQEDQAKLKEAYDNEQKKKAAKKVWFEKWKSLHGSLDFSCTSDVVKSQFSCGTLKIVEKHLYDLNYNNFRNVIASYGGFENYAKSLGGVFAEYYGKELNVTTESEFQKVAEYTFGWMYMYGMDYCSGDAYHNWGVGYGESGHSDDAFYSGNFKTERCTSDFDQRFDEVISGAGKNSNLIMATECGPAATAPLYKAGVLKPGVTPNKTFVTSFKDLRPGDVMYFFDSPVGDKSNRSTWGRGRHNVLIGEVYDDRIVIYDGGSHFQTTRNYKRVLKMVNSEAEEYAEVKREFGFGGWAAERFGNLERK